MSDDLVKRLREIETGQRGWGYARHAADRIEELEFNLAKALAALHAIKLYSTDGDACRKARMTIVELTGGKDE